MARYKFYIVLYCIVNRFFFNCSSPIQVTNEINLNCLTNFANLKLSSIELIISK